MSEKQAKNVRPPYKNYEENQRLIAQAYTDYAAEGVSEPSFRQIADKTGISINTVYNHFKRIDFDYICKKARVNTENVMKALATKACEGNVQAARLYFMVAEGLDLNSSAGTGKKPAQEKSQGTIKVVVERKGVTSREQIKEIEASGKSEDVETSVNISIPMIGNATASLLTGKKAEADE